MSKKPKPVFSKPIALSVGLILAATLGVVSAYLVLPQRVKNPVYATVLSQTLPLPEFDLIDQKGRDFTRDRMTGHWSLVFFGFTNCPDICPTTLSRLAKAKDMLADLEPADRPEIVFVSVDPMRDTADKLDPYVSHFDPEFTGLTGDLTEIQALTTAIGVAAHYQPQGESYTVDHTAAVFLVDPTASMAAVFGTPHDPPLLAEDYRRIINSM